ncbi:hypothetical protein GHT06_001826 [Daphnia sinensis]|uniref:Uncharacterized protein n=1 Tax=Daphnia sinensis TaxID=1820382 RepID=A0AAD5KDD3_9CRUS|nr:hypothetical protein GHT06_001826 [Daphnia sinensis]
MGKTVTAAGYLLWYAMFNPDSTILVAAHKFAGAQEIMQRIRYAYENCPDHIRAGVVTYNKGSLDFENGSRIVSATTTENTDVVCRYHCCISMSLHSFAHHCRIILDIYYPNIATGGKCIITSTPNSDEDQFAKIWFSANKLEDEYGNPTELGVNGFRPFKALWNQHPDRDENGNSNARRMGAESLPEKWIAASFRMMKP